MSSNQDASIYYVRRNGKLYGPLSMERIGYCAGRNIFGGTDMISSDQLNWISIEEFSEQIRMQSAPPPPPQQTNRQPLQEIQTGSHRLEGFDDQEYVQPQRETNFAGILTLAVIGVVVLLLLGGGGYFVYDRYFSSSSALVVGDIDAVVSLQSKFINDKVTRKEFWQEALKLAQDKTPLIGLFVFAETPGVNEEEWEYDKKQRGKIFEALEQNGDEWGALVKAMGEYNSRKGETASVNRKKYITVPIEEIDYRKLENLIAGTTDVNFLNTIWNRMKVLGAYEASRKASREIIQCTARRAKELKYTVLSYEFEAGCYDNDSQDLKTIANKIKEEEEEAKKFKIVVMDFKGRGCFVVDSGTLSYRHLGGEKPYRPKIDGERWDLKKYVLVKKNAGMALWDLAESSNVRGLYHKGCLYMLPRKKGQMEIRLKIFKQLDKE